MTPSELLSLRLPKARRDIESPFQAAIVQWVRLVAPHLIIFHVPNGGYRDRAEAAKLKWLGVLAGVHDLIIIDEAGLSYLLEVKAPDGVLSEDQIRFHARCREMQIPQATVTTIDDVRRAFNKWGLQTREAQRVAPR